MTNFLSLHLAVGELKTHSQIFFPRGKVFPSAKWCLAVLSLLKVGLIFWPRILVLSKNNPFDTTT